MATLQFQTHKPSHGCTSIPVTLKRNSMALTSSQLQTSVTSRAIEQVNMIPIDPPASIKRLTLAYTVDADYAL